MDPILPTLRRPEVCLVTFSGGEDSWRGRLHGGGPFGSAGRQTVGEEILSPQRLTQEIWGPDDKLTNFSLVSRWFASTADRGWWTAALRTTCAREPAGCTGRGQGWRVGGGGGGVM